MIGFGKIVYASLIALGVVGVFIVPHGVNLAFDLKTTSIGYLFAQTTLFVVLSLRKQIKPSFSQKEVTRQEAARSLDINANMLGRWIKEQQVDDGKAFHGNGMLTPEQEEIRKLKTQEGQFWMQFNTLAEALKHRPSQLWLALTGPPLGLYQNRMVLS